jgi:transglutaminase-like putative cysteine protease
VVIALATFSLLSPRMAGSPPRLDSMTPTRGKPGDVMIITGRNFGDKRDTSEVRISGVSPTSSDYEDWTDTRISVTIPEEATSGIVYVITKSGRSSGLLFINQVEIPAPASASARPGEPFIMNNSDNPIQPAAARVGDEITIYGMNFGLERGSSEVYFTWAGQQAPSSASLDLANLLPAREYDLTYTSWSDREITLTVPDGAASGNVLVTSDKGTSNAAYFVVNRGAGTKTYGSPRKYSVQYAMEVQVSAAAGENTLYLWMPRVLPSPEQRRIEAVTRDPDPMLENTSAALYSLSNLQKGGKYRIAMSWMFDRYSIETQVSSADVPAYDTTSEMYKAFTAADSVVPSGSPEIVKAAAAAVGQEKNPWVRARRLYDWLLAQVTPTETTADPLTALRSKRGDSFVYSSLYCALTRASGIPSRMVAGYLVGDTGQPTSRHFWDEIYVETLGWIPVDPHMGEGKSPVVGQDQDVDPKAYYFGNLDNRHVTFTKGLVMVNQMDPKGQARHHAELPYLFSLDEEAVGGLTAYAVRFEDLELTGTY